MGRAVIGASAAAAAPGGVPGLPGVDWPSRKAGQYYGPTVPQFTLRAISGLEGGVIACAPFFVPDPQSFDRIAFANTSTSQGGAKIRLGIYSDAGGWPDALIVDAGEITLSAAAATRAITISQTLQRGWYWLAYLCDTSIQLMLLAGRQPGDPTGANVGPLPWLPRELATWGAGNLTAAQGPRIPQAYGALPASLAAATHTFQAASADAFCPDILLRKA